MSMRERTPFPTADQIAARAHELFASGGRRVSLIPEYWRTAERELLARAADRTIQPERRRRARDANERSGRRR
jgi:hypothetical protein